MNGSSRWPVNSNQRGLDCRSHCLLNGSLSCSVATGLSSGVIENALCSLE
jgi:hypothetical protein